MKKTVIVKFRSIVHINFFIKKEERWFYIMKFLHQGRRAVYWEDTDTG